MPVGRGRATSSELSRALPDRLEPGPGQVVSSKAMGYRDHLTQPALDGIMTYFRILPSLSMRQGKEMLMADDRVASNLKGMDDLDFDGWNNADWDGVFAHHHTDDVLVDWKGQPPTHGIQQHIDAMKAYVESAGGTPPQITAHPIAFGSGDWTCVIGEFAGGGRMVTVAKWRDGAIAEEYIWS